MLQQLSGVHRSVRTQNDYSALRVSGKAGILLSVLSENKQATIPQAQVELLARAAGVDPVFELQTVLAKLEAQHLISRSKSGLEVLGLTSPTVLQHTADMFSSAEPAAMERAAVSLAELCSEQPYVRDEVVEQLGDAHKLSHKEVTELLDDAAIIGFADSEGAGSQRIYFNGSLFRRDEVEKVRRVLSGLSQEEQAKVVQVNSFLDSRPCMTEEELLRIVGEPLARKLLSIGMFELNEVRNPKEAVVYVNRPSCFCKFGETADAFDMAKALVSALTYGIHRSTAGRGKITMIDRLLRSLILGNWVGPATAIGEDYKVLEVKKVIRVKKAPKNGYHMQLIKKEVGEIALAAITEGDAAEHSLDLPGAAVSHYKGPEEKRVEVRHRRTEMSSAGLSDMLHSLRSGG